jgi:hypothetical protein
MWSSGVGSRMCNHKGSSLGTVAAALGPTMTRSVEARTTCVRRACTRKEIYCLPAGVKARRVPGRRSAGPKSSIQPIGGPRGVRQSPIEHACLRQYPIEQDFRGSDAHECVQHPGATAHSWCELKAVKTVPYRFNTSRARAGARSRAHNTHFAELPGSVWRNFAPISSSDRKHYRASARTRGTAGSRRVGANIVRR